MSSYNLRSYRSSDDVAEFLADREGLSGKRRHRFRLLLHDYGGFREEPAPGRSRLLILGSLLMALAGLFFDAPAEWRDRLAWGVFVLLSVILIWRLRREENKVRQFDRETDWEAFCLFLRPIILSDHPGLLDRNATHRGNGSGPSSLRAMPMPRGLINECGPDFWWAAVPGLWLGMASLLILHLTVGPTDWLLSLAFPAGGLLLGLTGWIFWRRLVYGIAESDSRLAG